MLFMPQVDLRGLRQCFFYAEEIKTLKQQVVQLRTHLKSKADEVEQYKVCVAYMYIVCVPSTIMLIFKDIHPHFFCTSLLHSQVIHVAMSSQVIN